MWTSNTLIEHLAQIVYQAFTLYCSSAHFQFPNTKTYVDMGIEQGLIPLHGVNRHQNGIYQ